MISFVVIYLPKLGKWAVSSSIGGDIVGYYTRKDSAIRKVKTLIKKEGGLHIFEVIQNDVSRFYRNDEQFNFSEFSYLEEPSYEHEQYDDLDCNVYLGRFSDGVCQDTQPQSELSAVVQNHELSELNNASQILGEALFAIEKTKEFLSYINGAKSIDYVREEDEAWGCEPKSWRESSPASMRNAPCACAVAGLPRSPPRLIGGDIENPKT